MKLLRILSFCIMIFSTSALAQSTETIYLSQEENQFFILINQFRTSLGLPTLEIHTAIQNAAAKHSSWMAEKRLLTHYGPIIGKTPFTRMEEEGYTDSTSMGENVACGNADAVKTFRQWAFSPGHLVNMISPNFQHMGISRAGTGNERCPYYWTNDFGAMNNLHFDQAEITDTTAIAAAIAAVSGPIPAGKEVKLPH